MVLGQLANHFEKDKIRSSPHTINKPTPNGSESWNNKKLCVHSDYAWMNSSLQSGCRRKLSMNQNPYSIRGNTDKFDYQKIKK